MVRKIKKPLHKVNLVFPGGLTRTVFERANSRVAAERRALKKNPGATGTTRSPFSQNGRV